MSFQATTAALALKGISPHEKLLLLAIANYADADGTCWPSQLTLATDTCLTDRTIRTLMHKLERRGLLERHRRTRPDGYRASDRIVLHILPEDISGEIPINLTGKSASILPERISGQEPIREPSKKGSGAKAPSPRARRATRLPDDWIPSDEERAIALKEGLTDEEIERESIEYRNYWTGKATDATKLSWSRTWHNHCLRFTDRKRRNSPRLVAGTAIAQVGRRGSVSFADLILRGEVMADDREPLSTGR